MSQRALRLARADLGHTEPPAKPITEAEKVAREAAWLAEIAGRFSLCGLRIDQPDLEPAPSAVELEAARLAELAGAFGLFGLAIEQPPEAFEPADLAYRADSISDAVPANDRAPGQRLPLPDFIHRGAYVAPRAAIGLIQSIDWVVVALAAEFAARWGAGASLAELSLGQAIAFVVSALALKGGLWITESYRVPLAQLRPERGIGGLALGAIAGVIVANVLAYDARAAAALAATVPIAAMLLGGVHAALAVWIGAAHRAGLFAETVVLIGANDAAKRFAARAAKTGEARIVAIVDDRRARAPSHIGDIPVASGLDDMLAWEGLPNIDRIVIAVPQAADARVRAMIERLRVLPNRIDLLFDFETREVRGINAERLAGAALGCVSGRSHNTGRAFVKRTQDIGLAIALLVIFAAPMFAIALAIKLDSKGPALYRQRRHGFNNRVMTILKFRTMRHDPRAPLRRARADDPRITRIGGWLRRTGLDELPLLLNVLTSEMSLVGPRPHAVGMKAARRELHHIVAEYAHRHRVKPGITGWAQVNGSRGPIETVTAVRQRLKLDLDYVANASLWLDLQILWRTALALLTDRKQAP
jgi:exopolysaccharide biosynthesis polyprenyl glycosylphosphotransferase